MAWKNIYRGMMMGASDVVPGVSGGTIAVLLGIYDQLIESINGIFSKEWKRHVTFLLPLGLGVATAILLLSKVMNWLLTEHPGPTYFFFLGLIIGIIPFLFREAEVRTTFKVQHYVVLIIGFILVGILVFFKDPSKGSIIVDKTLSTYVLLFFSGVLASAAMILPGVSGSLVFLILGVYPTVIAALKDFELVSIGVIGTGVLIGILSMSKVINFFLINYRRATFAIIIGSVIGSIIVIFPGWPVSIQMVIISIGTFASGLFVAYILGKVEYED